MEPVTRSFHESAGKVALAARAIAAAAGGLTAASPRHPRVIRDVAPEPEPSLGKKDAV